MSYSRILVPIDFSELSERALDRAVGLAKQLGASLTLLHVHEQVLTVSVDPADRPFETQAEQRQLIEVLTQKLQNLADALEFDGERIGVRVVLGNPFDEIVSACADHDLVVLATHGRRGLSQFLLGSVTERVVRAAPCSVLVVRPQPAS
jgi:nucleotide-binding universal stress UspA family protein